MGAQGFGFNSHRLLGNTHLLPLRRCQNATFGHTRSSIPKIGLIGVCCTPKWQSVQLPFQQPLRNLPDLHSPMRATDVLLVKEQHAHGVVGDVALESKIVIQTSRSFSHSFISGLPRFLYHGLSPHGSSKEDSVDVLGGRRKGLPG